jgi:hypothetical protein
MTDESTESPAGGTQPTSEERLRALTSDRKRKSRGKGKPGSVDPQHHPGDVVDAVRERSRDTGRDRPL